MTPQITSTLQDVRGQVESLLERSDLDSLRAYLLDQHPADIADLLELLDDRQRVVVFDLLNLAVASEVLDETRTEVTRDLVEAIPDEKIAALLETMPMDDAAEVLSELHDDRAEDILELMEPEEAAEVGQLLAYPENSAGRLMTTKIACLNRDWTAEEALAHLRTVDPEVETLAYLYVVNGDRQLAGVVPIRALIIAPPTKPIADLMEPSVVSVQAATDQEEVARVVSQYDFSAIPVLDQEQHFLGIITHDDVIDILEDEFTEDVQRFGGSAPLANSYLAAPVLTITRKRIGWLLVLFLTEMMTGTVMRHFEGELQQVVALSFFVPLLIGTGGNAGSQTTSTIIRALAVGDAHFSDLLKLLWHELRIGLLLGVAMAAVGFVRALTWRTTVQLALTVSGSLFAIVLWANLIGALLPPLADRLHIDPTVISGPVMSTLVDTTGLLIYFSLAQAIIGL